MQALERLVLAPGLAQRHRQLRLGGGIVAAAHRLFERLDRFLGAAAQQPRMAEQMLRARVRRIGLDRFGREPLGLIGLPGLQRHHGLLQRALGCLRLLHAAQTNISARG